MNLPEVFTEKYDFIQYKMSVDKKFLSADNFNDFKRQLEKRLKTMEEKIGHRFSLLTINRHIQKCDYNGKGCSKIHTFLKVFKMDSYTKWLLISMLIFVLSFVTIALLSEYSHLKQENDLLKQSIELIQHYGYDLNKSEIPPIECRG